MQKLQFVGRFPIVIPSLKSKGGRGFGLPLFNFNANTPLPAGEQIISVSENEASDLMRQWPGCFVEVLECKMQEENNLEMDGEEYGSKNRV